MILDFVMSVVISMFPVNFVPLKEDYTNIAYIDNLPGGEVEIYAETVSIVMKENIQVRVKGDCASACTLFLALYNLGQICYENPNAQFKFHRAYDLYQDGHKEHNDEYTRKIWNLYPNHVQEKLTELGDFFNLGFNDLMILNANEVIQECNK